MPILPKGSDAEALPYYEVALVTFSKPMLQRGPHLREYSTTLRSAAAYMK